MVSIRSCAELKEYDPKMFDLLEMYGAKSLGIAMYS